MMKMYPHLTSEPKANSPRSFRASSSGIFKLFSTASLLGLLLVTGVACGCKKKGTASAAPPEATASTADPANAAPASPPSPRGPVGLPSAPASQVVIQDNSNLDAILNQLSTELRKYVARTRSVPKTFDEFVAKSMVQAPPAPAGKKYAIENQAVVLVKR